MNPQEYIGIEKGEKCNRDGCGGIIDEHETDTSCSCHINPPCSHCVDSREFCPVCGWEGRDEQNKPVVTQSAQEFYNKLMDEHDKRRDSFYLKFNGKANIDKLEMMLEEHTHFSQIVKGVFPTGTETKDSLLPKVIGSFGGRWRTFTENTFEYVAYTD